MLPRWKLQRHNLLLPEAVGAKPDICLLMGKSGGGSVVTHKVRRMGKAHSRGRTQKSRRTQPHTEKQENAESRGAALPPEVFPKRKLPLWRIFGSFLFEKKGTAVWSAELHKSTLQGGSYKNNRRPGLHKPTKNSCLCAAGGHFSFGFPFLLGKKREQRLEKR